MRRGSGGSAWLLGPRAELWEVCHGGVPCDRHAMPLSCPRRRGTIVTAFIVCYALTSFVGGYVSGGFYSRNDGGILKPAFIDSGDT